MSLIRLMSDSVSFPNLFDGEIKLSRTAFSIFGFNLYWYAILIAVGMFLAVVYCTKRSEKFGVTDDDVFDVALIGGVIGFIGARAYYCIFWNLNPENDYKFTLWTAITQVHKGGLAIYGGIIASVIAAFFVCRAKKISPLPMLDLGGCGFLIGQAIGRWGNFVNQEAFGAATAGNLPWGMSGTGADISAAIAEAGEGALVHPCFLYESLWCTAGFLIIHFILSKIQTFDGELFLYYAIWYGAGRGLIEGLRTDSLYIGPLRVSQLLGFASAVFCIILLIYIKISVKKSSTYIRWKDRDISKERIEKYHKSQKAEAETEKAYKAMKKARKQAKQEEIAPSILGDDNNE